VHCYPLELHSDDIPQTLHGANYMRIDSDKYPVRSISLVLFRNPRLFRNLQCWRVSIYKATSQIVAAMRPPTNSTPAANANALMA
jgi:hypothetical protein